MKRQIIKTRPERPYRIARVAILVAVCAALALIAYLFWPRVRPAHAAGAPRTSERQELSILSMKPRSPAILT